MESVCFGFGFGLLGVLRFGVIWFFWVQKEWQYKLSFHRAGCRIGWTVVVEGLINFISMFNNKNNCYNSSNINAIRSRYKTSSSSKGIKVFGLIAFLLPLKTTTTAAIYQWTWRLSMRSKDKRLINILDYRFGLITVYNSCLLSIQ